MKERKLICECGRPLIDLYRNNKLIGVTHTIEDEDWHVRFWSKSMVKATELMYEFNKG